MLGRHPLRRSEPDMRLIRVLACVGLLLLLAACARTSEGVKRRVNPPGASVQELAVQADGQWRIALRLQNFSNVPTTFVEVGVDLAVAGQPAGHVQAQPALTIGPESADVTTVTLAPSPAARAAVAAALADGRSVRYRLAGHIATRDPKGSYPLEYESALSPVPGLAGVLR
jgi:hypothetical protein